MDELHNKSVLNNINFFFLPLPLIGPFLDKGQCLKKKKKKSFKPVQLIHLKVAWMHRILAFARSVCKGLIVEDRLSTFSHNLIFKSMYEKSEISG